MPAMSQTFGAKAVIGVDELLDKFGRLAFDVQNRISQNVLQAGVDYLVNVARDAVPTAITPGHTNVNIKNSIRGRLLESSSGRLMAKVGFNVGVLVAPHAHLYVLGTVDRFTKGNKKTSRGRLRSGGANRGVMPANNFFEITMNSAESAAFDVMQQVFYQEMAAFT